MKMQCYWKLDSGVEGGGQGAADFRQQGTVGGYQVQGGLQQIQRRKTYFKSICNALQLTGSSHPKMCK